MSPPPRVYRFALFGPANAGKTCLLAALASAHAPADGLACTWRGADADNPRPPGPEEAWAADDPAVARYRGAAWLQDAVRALEAGGLPPPNPTGGPLRLRFDFKDRGFAYAAEVADYSGELLDPGVSADALAARLRTHLRAADAVLVLAKAPRADEDRATAAADLNRLQVAFALLRQEGETGLGGAVVALVVNQWDRVAAAPDPATLEAFLASTAGEAHRLLAEAVRPRDGRDFAAFAASAFGRSRRVDGADLPAARPLPSFGLEGPFVWAARRAAWTAADRALAAIQAEAGQCGWWRVFQPFTRQQARRQARLRSEVERLRAECPDDFPHPAAAAAAVAATRAAPRRQLLALAVVACLLWAAGTAAADLIGYAAHRPAWAAGDPSVEDLRAAEDWLARRGERHLLWTPLGRLILPQEQADALIVSLRDRVSAAEQRRDRVTEQARQYYDASAGNRLEAAAAELARYDGPADHKAQLVEDFRRRAGEAFRLARAEHAARRRWDDGNRVFDLRRNEHVRHLLTAGGHAEADALFAEFAREHDRWLYARLQDRPALETCEAYLARNSAQPPRMREVAEKYRDHLAADARPLDVTLHLTAIAWGADTWGRVDKNSVKVWVDADATPVIDETVASERNGKASDVGKCTLMNAHWDRAVEVRVRVRCESGNFLFSDRSQGEGRSRSLTLRELKQGYALTLDRFGNVAHLKAAGGADPPALPAFPE